MGCNRENDLLPIPYESQSVGSNLQVSEPASARDEKTQFGFNQRSATMKTTFVVTVDVETRTGGESNEDISGVIPGYQGSYGVGKIMDLLERHQARGTFFLNVYEIAKHGPETVASAARLIHQRGHDLELHTHPRPMFEFYGMARASLDEQQAILKKGISLLEAWTGKKVVAHRAGAFSANTDTVRAVPAVGLQADCSLSGGSRVRVPLVDELGASNAVQRVEGAWEIPATCFDQVRFGPWHSRRILDIEGCSLSEIKRVTRWAIRRQLPTVCILMHSFSLSRHGRPNHRVIRRLSALLAWLREQDDVEIGTIEQVCGRLDAESLPQPAATATIPSTGVWLTWGRAVCSWDDGWSNFLVSLAGAGVLALLTLVLALLGYLATRH